MKFKAVTGVNLGFSLTGCIWGIALTWVNLEYSLIWGKSWIQPYLG